MLHRLCRLRCLQASAPLSYTALTCVLFNSLSLTTAKVVVAETELGFSTFLLLEMRKSEHEEGRGSTEDLYAACLTYTGWFEKVLHLLAF